MTLHEIEETLRTLQSRHNGLKEAELVTLLRAGGWEEKNIREAVLLFRSLPPSGNAAAPAKPQEVTTLQSALPTTETEAVFTPQADANHLLSEHAVIVQPSTDESRGESSSNQVPFMEQESLVRPAPAVSSSKNDELPHNLPLRPFETSDHVWPFSRYRDVFFGEEKTASLPAEPKTTQPKPEPVIEIVQAAPLSVEQKIESAPPAAPVMFARPAVAPPIPEKIKTEETLPKGDEKLIILAFVMLVLILILLGYMYSNGRL